jgi:cytochrome c-type biogenesis protein CcmH/NrfG
VCQGDAIEATGDAKGAIAAYRRALDLDPNSAAAQVGLGRALVHDNDYPNAITALTEALRLDPNEGQRAFPLLAMAGCEVRDYDNAWKAVAQCRRLGVPLPEDFLARLARESGRTQ